MLAMRRLRREERGATALEYGLIAGLIALGIVGGLVMTRNSLNSDYNCVATALGTQGSCTTAPAAPPPTSAYGYAQIMVPSNRTVTGNATDTSGAAFYYYDNSADPSVVGNAISLTAYSGPAYSPRYPGFKGTVVAPNVIQITSWSGSVSNPSGGILYGIVSPKGMIIVNTAPAS
jgi:pilus assembly protein Flp/PilA